MQPKNQVYLPISRHYVMTFFSSGCWQILIRIRTSRQNTERPCVGLNVTVNFKPAREECEAGSGKFANLYMETMI